MSLAPIGVVAPGHYSAASTHSYLSKEEQAFVAAQEYEKAFVRRRREEEFKRQVKEERKRIKKENKAKAKAQAKGRTLKPKKNKARRLVTYVKVKILRRRS